MAEAAVKASLASAFLAAVSSHRVARGESVAAARWGVLAANSVDRVLVVVGTVVVQPAREAAVGTTSQ